MEGSAEDIVAPQSWEVADVDESLSRLQLSTSREDSKSLEVANGSPSSFSSSPHKDLAEAINQVDQFLIDALQNPRERVSVLRMEQDVEKFIRDPTQQQLEFQQLPTSYLRLAAHRVAQHYSLQSMVLLENNLPDSSNSRIIVCKTPKCCKPPLIRLAEIPVNLPSEDSGVTKFAIKQRPQNKSEILSNANSSSSKGNCSKSVEERKVEYNRARARIFNSDNNSDGAVGIEPRLQDIPQDGTARMSKMEEKCVLGVPDLNTGRVLVDSSTGNSRSSRVRSEEPGSRYRPNSRVAILRDRQVECKDPDYNRNYDRYMQRFDPGFGFNGRLYAIQPMYTPAFSYNTEFPQLGPTHSPQIPPEHQPRVLSQHIPGIWASPSVPAGIGYAHPFSSNHVGPHSAHAIYMHSPQYPFQHPGVPFVHPHGHVYHTQSHQQQPDASYGMARPR